MQKFLEHIVGQRFVIGLTVIVAVFGAVVATRTSAADDFAGYAWFLPATFEGSDDALGWASLDCNNRPPCSPDYGITLELGSGNLGGEMWIGEIDQNANPPHTYDDAVGWLSFDPDLAVTGEPPKQPHGSPDWIAQLDTGTGEIKGWGRILTLKEEGEKHGFFGADGWGWVKFDAAGADSVRVNPQDRTLSGYAWSGGPSPNFDDGLGWLYFSDAEIVTKLPFYTTEGGNIYARWGVGDVRDVAPPTDFYTSTYLIQSSGAIRRVTADPRKFDGDFGQLDPNYRVLSFPQEANNFRNVIGALPEIGEWDTAVDGSTNKFGETIRNLPATIGGTLELNNNLGDSVLVSNSDVQTHRTQPLVFKDATQDKRGTLVMVVDGDLEINNSITYETPHNIGTADDLASVVWVVYGDVFVDESVENIEGVFIVLGDGAGGADGEFNTGSGGGGHGADPQLVVNGMVMAKKFNLDRNEIEDAGGDAIPAEKFVLDSRFFLNPPESLKDFADAIPRVTDVAR